MSKLNITDFEDRDITPVVLSPLVDEFFAATKRMPEAIVVTAEQWATFFSQANEKLSNFRGIPLETAEVADHTKIIVRTVAGVMSGMHTAAVRDVADVYRMLEEMKARIASGGKQ